MTGARLLPRWKLSPGNAGFVLPGIHPARDPPRREPGCCGGAGVGVNEFSPHVFRPPLSIPARLDPAFPVISGGSWVESTSGGIMDSSSPVRSFFGGFLRGFYSFGNKSNCWFRSRSLPALEFPPFHLSGIFTEVFNAPLISGFPGGHESSFTNP